MRSWMKYSNTKRKMIIISVAIMLLLSVGYIAQISQGETCSDVLFIETEGTGLFGVVVNVYSDIEGVYEEEPIKTVVIWGPIFGSYSLKFVDLDQEFIGLDQDLTSITVGISIQGDAYFPMMFKELDVDVPRELEIREITFSLLFTRTNTETIYPRYPIELVFIGIGIVIAGMVVPRIRWRKR